MKFCYGRRYTGAVFKMRKRKGQTIQTLEQLLRIFGNLSVYQSFFSLPSSSSVQEVRNEARDVSGHENLFKY